MKVTPIASISTVAPAQPSATLRTGPPAVPSGRFVAMRKSVSPTSPPSTRQPSSWRKPIRTRSTMSAAKRRHGSASGVPRSSGATENASGVTIDRGSPEPASGRITAA